MDSDTNTVLELRMKKASFLKNVSEVLSELFTTADFNFSSTGLELRAYTSDFPFAVLQLRSKGFDPHICDDDLSERLNLADLDDLSVRLNLAGMDNLSVRLNLADMSTKAFSFGDNDDIVTIKYGNDRKTITISLDSPEVQVISDLDVEFMPVPVVISENPAEYYLYDAIVRMPRAKFMNFCNKLSSFWDTGDGKTAAAVCISVDQDRVSFSTDGKFKSSTIVCLQTQNDDKPNEATCIEMEKKISLTFDLRYLKNFSMVPTLSDQVTIKLSPDLTSVFEHKTAKMGYIRYHMMPNSSDPPAPPLQCCPLVLELRMEEATFLKNLLEVLSVSGLFSKANFKFSSKGLELQAMDTCCFALVVLQLHPEAFDSYIWNNDGLSMGLILADMAKASSFANNNDIITIEAGVEAFVIKFKSPDGSVIQNFKLNFVSVDDVPVTIPEYQEFQYEAIIRMPSAKFLHIWNHLSSRVTDLENALVIISVDNCSVEFFTDGMHGFVKMECQLIQDVDKSKEAEAATIEVKLKENVSQTFSLRYMSSLCKAYTLSQQVTIKLSSKLPAVFEYNIAEKGHISYHVMPEEDKDAEPMTSGDGSFSYFTAIA